MKINYAAIGAFVVAAILLFSIGLFLIGDRHKAFSHHVDFYTDLADVNGLNPGTKVRVDGYDAGQLEHLQIPSRPSGKFRLKLHVDTKLRNLIRTDSIVSVESDGLVGDKFILIRSGSDSSPEAANNATLSGKEPIELSAVIAKATGAIDQASSAIGDVKVKLDGALVAVTGTVNNANGLVADARHGKGPVAMMLNDPQTATQLRETVANVTQASGNIKQISVQAGQVVSGIQSRNLPAKLDDTLNNVRNASQQLDQASKSVNATLTEVLGPDNAGETGAQNIQQTLSNVNLATANLADDTEALKHEFFFRGFFKKRGFYSLRELTPDQYRSNSYFQNPSDRRAWIDASIAFTKDSSGAETLSSAGAQQIDDAMGGLRDQVVDQPIVIEGYSAEQPAAQQIIESRSRSLLVAQYLEKRFHLRAQDIGVMPLNDKPPSSSGKSSWNGVCIVILINKK
jgi:phospholipid/cholesterol/gamma-HCH transport system substrate-binding protein